MSKTSPVRWWRDDGDRYSPRGAQRPTGMTHQLRTTGLGGWCWHMKVRDSEPELGAVIDRFQEIIISQYWLPSPWLAPTAPNPIDDIQISIRSWLPNVKFHRAWCSYGD